MAKRKILTPEELEISQRNQLESIRELLNEHSGIIKRKWLKSNEVIDMLRLSPTTLNKLRDSRTIPHIKLNGTIYYEYSDILRMLDAHKVNELNASEKTETDQA